jgi:hypothetical protein
MDVGNRMVREVSRWKNLGDCVRFKKPGQQTILEASCSTREIDMRIQLSLILVALTACSSNVTHVNDNQATDRVAVLNCGQMAQINRLNRDGMQQLKAVLEQTNN